MAGNQRRLDKYYKILHNITKYYKILQNITKYFSWNPFRKKSGLLRVMHAQSKKNHVVSKEGLELIISNLIPVFLSMDSNIRI